MFIHGPVSFVSPRDSLDADYVQGLEHARQGDWQAALDGFSAALKRIDPFHVYYALYSSAEGLAKVMNGDAIGLNQCRQAVLDDPKHIDLYENLARACIRLKQRKKAVDALSKGLRVMPHHPGLNQFRQEIGFRRRPAIPFLGRDNPLNQFIGRRTYRHSRAISL